MLRQRVVQGNNGAYLDAWFLPIVVAAGDDDYPVFPYGVDETVFIIDAAAPIAAEVVFQRLRLTKAFVAVAIYVGEQQVDTAQSLFVLCLPV